MEVLKEQEESKSLKKLKSKISRKNVLPTGFSQITEPDEVQEKKKVEVPLEIECVESDSDTDSNSTDWGVSHAEDMIKQKEIDLENSLKKATATV